jgi:putative flippase GtrA
VALVNVGIMTILVGVLDAPPQPSLLLAYTASLAVHFTVNRNLVFATDAGFALHLSAQGMRYLSLALSSYAITAVALAVLPGLLDLPVLVVYLVTVGCLAVVNFVLLQGLIFHPPAQERADGSSSRSSLSSKP